jgi:LemA protein
MGSFRQKSGLAVVGFLVVILALGALVFGWYMSGYNAAIAKDERVKAAWAQVENQLQRRNDLIPNLVNTVKGFAAQEKNIFTEVTRLRSQWGQAATINEKIENANAMTAALSRLLVVQESYPQLKSNENFLALQSQLEGTENRIAVERMRYNEAVQDLNRYQRSFFGKFFAAKAGVLEPAVYFKAEEKAAEVPQVAF